ncbi:DUF881 domain-containing protein [Anaerosalibacter bizertensis]|nr:DUF881 domain-containing protein [Anaerosalibacter bizertensis]MBV1817805.1 DUF881 domain-containing protein [Bacteroidales bacterium MSK.15.36]MCB5559172.1 DUF881 domain-containing protein [Anaerosalibacter bizertensis]MCG4564515.1 DUF881 domain-containing protein [Anaerosalibacter bizertensis]MCG4581405.1 DUF881 domain-containing protein [Anaerosalibacter bizertensis]MCG4583968.1 DUF881 domain-containing protein [Anaerosalibacter bizertensis]
MKKVSSTNITLLVFSIFLGFFAVTQMKQNVESYNLVTLKSIQVTKNEINNTYDEIKEMESLIKSKKEELEKLEGIKKNDAENIHDILVEGTETTKVASGFTDMEGPGIVIKMWDNQDTEIKGVEISDDVIHDMDILMILNDLRIAGAEAISINGQRVMPMSEIKCGGPIVKINGKSLGTPFVIKAIGDPKLLNAAVNAPATHGYELKNFNKINIESNIEDNVFVPGYSGRFRFKYAKPIKEGD